LRFNSPGALSTLVIVPLMAATCQPLISLDCSPGYIASDPASDPTWAPPEEPAAAALPVLAAKLLVFQPLIHSWQRHRSTENKMCYLW